ncbi:MAG: penicillin-binding protein 1A [Gammaproteobacteria bacterium]
MSLFRRFTRFTLYSFLSLSVLAMLAVLGVYLYIEPKLPNIDQLQDVQYSVPLRIYTRDGKLMGEFGEQRRRPTKYEDLPKQAIQAILAIEDNRFFEHKGIDYRGLLRAGVQLLRTGRKSQGGSTITMQVAKNFFLSSEKTYLRKLNEIFLALKIERALSKQQILELYLNKIYFGQRAYGIGAAARVYYGTPLDDLALPQMAMIAGLPKAPSSNNPISNPERALIRRNYVLKRMYVLNFINSQEYLDAIKVEDNATVHTADMELEAAYVAEMVRNQMIQEFGEKIYSKGYRVVTTIDSKLQDTANRAIQAGLLDYNRRHGYRGVEGHVDLPENGDEIVWQSFLEAKSSVSRLLPALVIATKEQSAKVFVSEIGLVTINWDGLSWASLYVDVNKRGEEPQQSADILQPGDLIRVEALAENQWRLAQIPDVEGALVSLRPNDGALLALAGGFDFFKSKFNRAVQAQRQPGSSFKPFIYSAALAKDYTLASVFNDAPVVFDDPELETMWRPRNSSGRFYGPTRMRVALTNSRNLVSIRLLRSIGIAYAADFVERFGFTPEQIRRDLSLALGSSTVTPMQMARAYSVIANGGYLVEPYFIQSVIDTTTDEEIFTAKPVVACQHCYERDSAVPAEGITQAKQVMPDEDVFLLTSMLQDVIKQGTGKAAMALGRSDLSGKTGTTNDQRDAWFCGFNSRLVTTVWVGFDQVQELGNGEYGGKAALPIWMDYMRIALVGVPEVILTPPDGIVTARIDSENGLLMPPESRSGIEEFFREGNVPEEISESAVDRFGGVISMPDGGAIQEEVEPLF